MESQVGPRSVSRPLEKAVELVYTHDCPQPERTEDPSEREITMEYQLESGVGYELSQGVKFVPD